MSEAKDRTPEDKAPQSTQPQTRNAPRLIQGVVLKDKMNKMRVIRLEWLANDKIYKKKVKRHTKLFMKDEKNQSKLGDTVTAVLSRPQSKRCSYRLYKVEKRGALA